MLNYSEAAYFDGNHCQHVATYQDAKFEKHRERRRTQALREYQGVERRRKLGTH